MIFRILADLKLSDALNEKVSTRVDEKLRTIGDFAQKARRSWDSRPSHVSITRYAVFRALHQEFSGEGLPGLPTLLGAGRRLFRAAPWLKKGILGGRTK